MKEISKLFSKEIPEKVHMPDQQHIVPVDSIADIEGQKEENDSLSHPEGKAGKVLKTGSR